MQNVPGIVEEMRAREQDQNPDKITSEPCNDPLDHHNVIKDDDLMDDLWFQMWRLL